MNIKKNIDQKPLISIGMPVFNGEKTLKRAIDSILTQSLTDFELIISDNHSTDSTRDICIAYAKRDKRVNYIEQSKNIGAIANFKFVLERSQGNYFMWAAADDVRSSDFLETNVNFLLQNPDFIASTSPNCFEDEENNQSDNIIKFGLYGTFEQRVLYFLNNCWHSHAIFYSVMRTEAIRDCTILNSFFLGLDWAVILHIASKGQINRSDEGLLVFGRYGLSSNNLVWRLFRVNFLYWLVPFYRFSKFTLALTYRCQLRYKFLIAIKLFVLNYKAACSQLYAEMYLCYLRYFKSWIRRIC